MFKGPQETVRDNKSLSYPVCELPGVNYINCFTVNQYNCYQICYRNSNFVTISRDMRYVDINFIL